MSFLDSRVVEQSQIVLVPITLDMRQRIEANAAARRVLNSKTLVGGEGNTAGFAGEEIVQAHLPMLVNDTKCLDWDFTFTIPAADNNTTSTMTIDVKSKGNNKAPPRPFFDCTVPKYQVAAQQCNVYIFTRIAADLSCGWINGWIPKDRFIEEGEDREAGTSFNNAGRETKENHLVVPISALVPIQSLKDLLLRYAT